MCQALKEFYLKDSSLGGSWHMVEMITNINIYNVHLMTLSVEDDNKSFGGDLEIEDDPNLKNCGPINANDLGMPNPLH